MNIHSEPQLIKLLSDANLDQEYSITLRYRDWVTIAAMWYNYGGDLHIREALQNIQQHTVLPEGFRVCGHSSGHDPTACADKRGYCTEERPNIEKALNIFLVPIDEVERLLKEDDSD